MVYISGGRSQKGYLSSGIDVIFGGDVGLESPSYRDIMNTSSGKFTSWSNYQHHLGLDTGQACADKMMKKDRRKED